MLGVVDFLPKRGQATVGLLSPYTLSVTGTKVTIWSAHTLTLVKVRWLGQGIEAKRVLPAIDV